MTDYRIPRWFSEGLSVYEERTRPARWGDDWNPMFLRRLPRRDAGTRSPTSMADSSARTPLEDLSIAYFQASQVCEFIVDRFGFDASSAHAHALSRKRRRPADILTVAS